jgi:magnesium transporter
MGHSRKNRYREFRRRTKPGAVPGTIIKDPNAHPSSLRLMAYDQNQCKDFLDPSVSDVRKHVAAAGKAWLHVTGLADLNTILELGSIFDLHDLALEDVVNVHQRPKVEDYDGHYFAISRYATGELDAIHQLAIFVGPNYVLSFQEAPDNVVQEIIDRLLDGKGKIRTSGSDYLAYALLDACVDSFFPALEKLGDDMEDLEDRIVSKPDPAQVTEIQALKHRLSYFRRSVWPMRDALSQLTRNLGGRIEADTIPYIRDCIDHSVQLLDIIENYREVASAMLELYLANLNQRLNDIMRILTLIATVFLPLSFIASLYGMNFDRSASTWNMPELSWRFGYVYVLLLMTATASGLLYFFRSRGWLKRRS